MTLDDRLFDPTRSRCEMAAADPLERCAHEAIRLFRRRHARDPEACAVAPGRVNLIGDHVDYLGGPVLPMSIDLGVAVALDRGGAPGSLELTSPALALDACTPIADLDLDCEPKSPETKPTAPAVARALIARTLRADDGSGPLPSGWRVVVHATLPPGAGLSSSAALVIATLDARDRLLGEERTARERIDLARTIEHEAIGVPCGIMDQTAIVDGRRDVALLVECDRRGVTPIELPSTDDALVVVVDSGEPRRLASGEYAARRRALESAAARYAIDRWTDVSAATWARIDADADAEARSASGPGPARDDEPIARRARHAIGECRRVEAAVRALRSRDLPAFGRLLGASHDSLRRDFAVSTPRLDAIVERLADVEGVFGARLTGAGFGGAVIALLHPTALERMNRAMQSIDLAAPRLVRSIGGARTLPRSAMTTRDGTR